jgi:hypothetical protein
MFPKPQCPICGDIFETAVEVMHHLDASPCDESLIRQASPFDGESHERLADYESADPTASTVEGAG